MNPHLDRPKSTDTADMAYSMMPPKIGRQKQKDKSVQDQIKQITDEDQFFHMLATVDKLGKAIEKLQK